VESLLTTAASTEPAAPASPASTQPAGGTPTPPVTPPAADKPAAPTPSTPPKEPASAQTPPAKPATGAPEKYDLNVEANSAFAGDVRTSFEAVARKHGLSNAAAQELLSEVSPKLSAQRAAQIDAAVRAQREQWYADSVNHPKFGGDKLKDTLAVASKALALGDPQLGQFLKDTGLDMHPLIIGWAAAVGRALAPDRIVTAAPGAPSSRKSDGEVFFSKVDKQ